MSDHSAPSTSRAPEPQPLSRRAFLGRFAALGTAGLGAAHLLAACGGGDTNGTTGTTPGGETGAIPGGEAGAAAGEYPVVDASSCQGYDQLDDQALSTRNTLSYVDETPEEGQYCGNCQFQQEYAQDTNCIGCQLFAGPVSPGGWCMSWAQLQA